MVYEPTHKVIGLLFHKLFELSHALCVTNNPHTLLLNDVHQFHVVGFGFALTYGLPYCRHPQLTVCEPSVHCHIHSAHPFETVIPHIHHTILDPGHAHPATVFMSVVIHHPPQVGAGPHPQQLLFCVHAVPPLLALVPQLFVPTHL